MLADLGEGARISRARVNQKAFVSTLEDVAVALAVGAVLGNDAIRYNVHLKETGNIQTVLSEIT